MSSWRTLTFSLQAHSIASVHGDGQDNASWWDLNEDLIGQLPPAWSSEKNACWGSITTSGGSRHLTSSMEGVVDTLSLIHI